MQLEADQQLAALQQQSQPSHQRDWANGLMGNVQAFHGHQPNGNLNGARPHDGTGMVSQESPIMEDSPPNQARFAGVLRSQCQSRHEADLSVQKSVQSNQIFCVSCTLQQLGFEVYVGRASAVYSLIKACTTTLLAVTFTDRRSRWQDVAKAACSAVHSEAG